MDLKLRIITLEADADYKKGDKGCEEPGPGPARRNVIDYNILVDESKTVCRALCGLSHEFLTLSPSPFGAVLTRVLYYLCSALIHAWNVGRLEFQILPWC